MNFELDSERVLRQVQNWLTALSDSGVKANEDVVSIVTEAVMEVWRWDRPAKGKKVRTDETI